MITIFVKLVLICIKKFNQNNFMKLKNYLPNQLIKCNQESTSYSKKVFLFFAALFLTVASSYSQNIISVPFNSGFVGNNTANNAATNCYYTNSLGWSNLQFSQNSTTTIFVAQGNDIIGSVLITDSNGTKHTINGFVKWRTPSGNSPNTLVFSPSQSVTLATNSSNGSATYTLDATKYIGLTFNGSTITIANDGS